MTALITEKLGCGLVVELDPATGKLTLISRVVGIELEPTQVWLLGSLIDKYKLVWGEHAANQLIAAAEGE